MAERDYIVASDEYVASRFRAISDWCGRSGTYRGGWPNFEQAAYDVPNRVVYGHFLMREPNIVWQDVPAGEYRSTDLRTRFVGAHDYARRTGFAHGFPNFQEANYGRGLVYGTFLMAPGTCEWRDVMARDLGLGEDDPARKSIDDWIRGASRYALDNGYAAGLPNGNYLKYPDGWRCGVMLVPHGIAEHVDIRGRELGLHDRSDPPTGPAAMGNTVRPGETLSPNQTLASTNGRFALVMQGDGNLVLYQRLRGGRNRAMWASGTDGRQVSVCILQLDGNVVLYDAEVRPIWDSGTGGRSISQLVVQDDGNLVLYQPDGTPVWSTDTPKLHFSQNIDGFEGNVEVTLRPSGKVRFSGHVHNGGIESFAYRLIVTVKTSDRRIGLAMARKGDVGGWQILSNDSHDEWWTEDVTSPPVATYWEEFAIGSEMVVKGEKTGSITGFLGDAIEFLLKYTVGALVVAGPGIGLLIFAGVELFSLATSGSLVPGARMIGGVLWLAGPYGTLLAAGAEAVAAIGAKSRELTANEHQFATATFGDNMPPRDQILINDSIGPDNRPYVFPRFDGKITMNLGPGLYNDPVATNVGTFVHELTHVWQVHHSGDVVWIAAGLAAQVCNSLGKSTYDPGPPGRPFGDYNLEQQATIVQRWYVRDRQSETSQWYPYIRDNIRQGLS